MAYRWIVFGHSQVTAGMTYSLGETFPITRDGETFGFNADLTANARDRANEGPRQLRGIVFRPNAAGEVEFRWNLLAGEGPGTYNFRFAAGDGWSNDQTQRISVRNGSGGSELIAISASTAASLQWVDAANAVRTGDPRIGSPTYATSWDALNAPASIAITAGHLAVALAVSSAANSSTICAIGLEFVSGLGFGAGATLARTTAAGTLSAVASAFAAGATLGRTTAAGALGPAPGVITSEPLRTNDGGLLAGVALDYVDVYLEASGVFVGRFTGLSTNGAGVFTVSSPLITPGTAYKLDWRTTGGQRRMPSTVAA
jgi:hypothetical protein